MIKDWNLFPKDQEQDKDAQFTTAIQYCTGSSSQSNYARKKIIGNQLKKKENSLYSQMTWSCI